MTINMNYHRKKNINTRIVNLFQLLGKYHLIDLSSDSIDIPDDGESVKLSKNQFLCTNRVCWIILLSLTDGIPLSSRFKLGRSIGSCCRRCSHIRRRHFITSSVREISQNWRGRRKFVIVARI